MPDHVDRVVLELNVVPLFALSLQKCLDEVSHPGLDIVLRPRHLCIDTMKALLDARVRVSNNRGYSFRTTGGALPTLLLQTRTAEMAHPAEVMEEVASMLRLLLPSKEVEQA